MNRKIIFGGTFIIDDIEIQNKAILIENDKIKNIGNLKDFVKTEPISTFTDLININGKTIKIE